MTRITTALRTVGHYLFMPIRWAGRVVRNAWRRVTYEGLKKVATLFLIATAIAVIAGVIGIYSLLAQSRERGIENQSTLKLLTAVLEKVDEQTAITKEQTSPEAQARNAELIQQIIDQITTNVDCTSQLQTQRLADALKALGIPEEGSIELVTAACRAKELGIAPG